ncbi:MAG: ribulose-phosphate 3-epimerase [Planctomycetales bacterium]|nr:ribulose-phosphate 3-epimerase [Planctomycetales bacterium]
MPQSNQLARLRESSPAVLPSLLLCDFGNLEREVRDLEEAGVQGYHLDVMDGQFVPNLSYGLPIVEAMRRLTDLPLDVHLMIVDPGKYVRQFVEAGADVVTIHREAVEDPRPVLEAIRAQGAGAGLAINPPTALKEIQPVLSLCDLVLVMSVMPGFGGQVFDPVALDKLRTLRATLPEDVLLEVDGGVNEETIAACGEAGAQLLVAGSAIFRKTDYTAALSQLTRLAAPIAE